MKVPRSGYYEWLKNSGSIRTKRNEQLTMIIKSIFQTNREVYGSRRIKIELAKQNIRASRRLIIKLMQKAQLCCKVRRKFKVTTNSKHNKPIAPNLLARQFIVDKPNSYWVGDITYIHTLEGWLYLATVIDLFSRQVVGWSMSDNLKADLVNNALLMAIWKRKPPKGLIWHTDRGSQYACENHSKILSQHHITQSMSRKGDCWDNAVAESFFHTLKTELTNNYKFKSREEARNVIFEYIEVFYNRIRSHSTNGYLSPVAYELMHHKQTLTQKCA
jgi:putative transposase